MLVKTGKFEVINKNLIKIVSCNYIVIIYV